MSRAKNWCFTVNNYTDDNIAHLRSLGDNDVVSYIIFGKEVAPTTNTPHLQGYIALKKQTRLNQVRALIPNAHLTVARGNATFHSSRILGDDYNARSNDFGSHSYSKEYPV